MIIEATQRNRIRIVQSLITGLTLEDIAREFADDGTGPKTAPTAAEIDRIRDIAAMHGYPNRQAMRKAADALKRNLDVRPAPTPAAVAAHTIEGLLTEAENHSLARVRNAGRTIRNRIDSLRKLIDSERIAEDERKRQEAEKQQALARIAELQREIRKIKTAAGIVRKSGPSTAAAQRMKERHERQRAWLADRGVTLTEVKAWALARGMRCADSVIPEATRQAWDAENREELSA